MLESTILSSIVFNEGYARKVIPYLSQDYFSDASDKLVYNLIVGFFAKFNKLPSREILLIELSNTAANQNIFKKSQSIIEALKPQPVDDEWLLSSTEKFCQDKAIYNSIMESIQILDGKSKLDKGAIPGLLQDALGISFDTSVGHDYTEDVKDRYDSYHEKLDVIPMSISLLNKVFNGGVSRKTLLVVMGGTGSGKSLFMCSEAAFNLLSGKNVLYITMEMSEKKISERIDANLLDTPIQYLKDFPYDTFVKKIERLKSKTPGKLVVKEYPSGSAHAGHFRYLLNELKAKKNFVPDIVYIDYLNICASSRVKIGNVNSYTFVKSIAEEVRGLAMEFNIPIISATQVNRAGHGTSDMDMTDTAESWGLPQTVDYMIALIVTEELEALKQIMIKQLKNRYGDVNYYNKFLVGIDRAKMRLYNIDNKEETDEPVFDKTTIGINNDKFKSLSF